MGWGQHGGGVAWGGGEIAWAGGSLGVGQYSRELLGQHGIEFGWWAAGNVQCNPNLSTAVPMKHSKFVVLCSWSRSQI